MRTGIDNQGIALSIRADKREIGKIKYDIFVQPGIRAGIPRVPRLHIEIAILRDESEVGCAFRVRRLQVDVVRYSGDGSASRWVVDIRLIELADKRYVLANTEDDLSVAAGVASSCFLPGKYQGELVHDC